MTLILRDHQINEIEVLCLRHRVSPDVLIGQLVEWAGILAFNDNERRLINGRRMDHWSTLVEEEFQK